MTDWKKLKHAEGPATEVPSQVAALIGRPDLPAFDAAGSLGAELVGDGKWFSATAPAAALLLDRLSQAHRKHVILMLVADMVGADHARAWLPSAKRAPKEVEQVVIRTR